MIKPRCFLVEPLRKRGMKIFKNKKKEDARIKCRRKLRDDNNNSWT